MKKQEAKKGNKLRVFFMILCLVLLLVGSVFIINYRDCIVVDYNKSAVSAVPLEKALPSSAAVMPLPELMKVDEHFVDSEHYRLDIKVTDKVDYEVTTKENGDLLLCIKQVKCSNDFTYPTFTQKFFKNTAFVIDGETISWEFTLQPQAKFAEAKFDNHENTLVLCFEIQIVSEMKRTLAAKSIDQIIAEGYWQIDKLLENGQISEAIHELTIFVGKYPNEIRALILLITLLIQQGGPYKRILNLLDLGLKRAPQNLELIVLKGQLLVRRGEFVAAEKFLCPHFGLGRNQKDYLALLAMSYEVNQKHLAAAELYRALTKLEPQDGAWWWGLGTALEALGKSNAAMEAYRTAYAHADVSDHFKRIVAEKLKQR